MMSNSIPLNDLLTEIRACRICEDHLEPNPVLRARESARLLIIGQAPGSRVHKTGIPWNDPSGDRLRRWTGLDKDRFYDESRVAIIPMGFCYPGKGVRGDLPPRKECFHAWHEKLRELLPDIECTLLIGQYAQAAYLTNAKKSLTENVRHWRDWFPKYIPMPHPSPRNTLWLKQRPWFEEEVVPNLQKKIEALIH